MLGSNLYKKKTSWYKKKRKKDEEDEKEEGESSGKRRKDEKEIKEEKVERKEEKKVKAVLFSPYTKNSALAMKLREAEEKLATLTGYKLKIVERAGTKLEDLLTKSKAWQGIDCGRKLCLLCETKEKTGKNKGQDCHKRMYMKSGVSTAKRLEKRKWRESTRRMRMRSSRSR